MEPLRSGQSTGGQWRQINAQGRSGQFTRAEAINALLRLSGGCRQRLVGGGSAAGNFNIRGLYNPVLTYALYDAVVLGSGPSTGLYWSTMDNNNNAPDSGIGWLQLATVQGQWL